MLRITKLADYAIVVLSHLSAEQQGSSEKSTARNLSHRSGLPQPTVSKLLKELARSGLVVSERGLLGGYRLARDANAITVADIVHAVEGPIALTECNLSEPEACGYAGACPVEANWIRINDAIVRALGSISLAEMAKPFSPPLVRLSTKRELAHA
ncbi:MAG TPA: SUF system Fe-S cluster assembly regulator [Polyangiaceae bacterium]